MQDWPAAHSMDTSWWGLDRFGRVAHFRTGEPGAVPAEQFEDSGGMAFRNAEHAQKEIVPEDALPWKLTEAGVPFHCEDLFPRPDGRILHQPWHRSEAPQELARLSPARRGSFLLWLRDEDALARVRALEEAREGLRLKVEGKVVLWVPCRWVRPEYRSLPRSVVLDWRDRRLVLGAWEFARNELDLWRFGLFQYEGSAVRTWFCPPYLRLTSPGRALSLRQLPQLQDWCDPFLIPEADFERDMLLQLYEHADALSWGEIWVSTTGQQHEGQRPLPPAPPSLPPLEVSGSAARALFAGYLQGDAAATAVLGDWLAEQGRPPLSSWETVERRLEEVMLRCLQPRQRELLEADFVERLAQALPLPPEVELCVSLLLDCVRQGEFLEGDAAAALEAWRAEAREPPGELHRVAWAAWALGRRIPLIAARTARALGSEQLAYQAQAVLSALSAAGEAGGGAR